MNTSRLLTCAALLAATAGAALADTTSGNLYYTEYNAHTVNKVSYSFDGTTFSLGTPTQISQLPGADGILFAPNGNIMVGGQGTNIYQVNPNNGTYTTSTTSGSSNFHLSLSPDGQTLYGGGIPGPLNEVALPGFGTGSVHNLTWNGNSFQGVDTIAFDPNNGQAYFTSSSPNGNGYFGTIDLTNFTVNPIAVTPGNYIITAAHGLAWDSYSNDFVLMGDGDITTYNPTTGNFSTRVIGPDFDQGTVDGKGHLFVAGSGDITFIDYTSTGDVTSSSSYTSSLFVAGDIDDVAPLSGSGSQHNSVPDSTGLEVSLAMLLPLLLLGRPKALRRCA